MSYVELDDLFPHHRKVRRAGARALEVVGLYTAGLAFCQRHLTDGVILEEDLALVCPSVPSPDPELLDTLVRVGLWERLKGKPGGWKVHDYAEHNWTKEERLAARAKDAARKRKARTPPTSNGGPE